MPEAHIDKRSLLVNVAEGLAYRNGFGATSLAEVDWTTVYGSGPRGYSEYPSGGGRVNSSRVLTRTRANHVMREGRGQSYRSCNASRSRLDGVRRPDV
jgi:hypothetical protein